MERPYSGTAGPRGPEQRGHTSRTDAGALCSHKSPAAAGTSVPGREELITVAMSVVVGEGSLGMASAFP